MDVASKLDERLWNLLDRLELPKAVGRWPWLGTVLTAGYLVVVDHLFLAEGLRVTLAPTFAFLVISVYLGGFWWGLASAALVIPAEWHFWPGEHWRNVVVAATQGGTLVLVSVLQRKAIQRDSLDGNVRDLTELERELTRLLEDWDSTERKVLRHYVVEIRHRVRDLATRTRGWRELSQKIEQAREILQG